MACNLVLNDSGRGLPDRPILDVRLPDALPEAFEKVLDYIYTDRIECKFCLNLA